jgi:LCP family protein required for cell wall assembly
MPKEDSVWSSHPNISRTLAPETQPSPRLRAAVKPAGRRKPIGLYVLTGALALVVLMCASLSVVLASIGPGTLLALRDRWLGRNLQETVTTLGQVAQVIATEQDVWPAPDNGRVTILLLGIDARNKLQAGASRTDVMTLVTIDPIKTAALLSSPDLYVPLPGYNDNHQQLTLPRSTTAGGGRVCGETVTYNFGVPLQRYAVIDFEGFKGIVDAVGGVDIDVPQEIVDYEYPTPDYRTEVLKIPAGRIHMDGELALKYVRTRHGDSDFGRLQRQQQVILAIRDKAVSIGSLNRVPEVLNAVSDSLQTDLTLPEILSLARQWSQIPRENIHNYRIDETMVQPYVTPQGGQVLLPDRDKIAEVVAMFLGLVPASQKTAQQ